MNIRSVYIALLLASTIPHFVAASSGTVRIDARVGGCGDYVISAGEQCDGSNLGGASCSSLGFSSGVLLCTDMCTFNTASCSNSSGSSGSIGAAFVAQNTSSLSLSGRAMAGGVVAIMRDGVRALTVTADDGGVFRAQLSNIPAGDWSFGFIGRKDSGSWTDPFTFSLRIPPGQTISISGIVLPPSVTVDTPVVMAGDSISLHGITIPNAEVAVFVRNNNRQSVSVRANALGEYAAVVSTKGIAPGQYGIQAKSYIGTETSIQSAPVYITVNSASPSLPGGAVGKILCDINQDGRVNIIDFSILLIHFEKSWARADFNQDNRVDIIDLSIMLSHWTG